MKTKSISKLLGVKQETLSQIIGVSRSQLSLYEIGKRDLPTKAKLKLSVILEEFNRKSTVSKNNTTDLETTILNSKSIIEELKLINKENQLTIEKKINTIIAKYESSIALQHFISILENLNNNSDKKSIKLLKQKINLQTDSNKLNTLLPLKIKLEVLKQEEKILQKYLNQAIKT